MKKQPNSLRDVTICFATIGRPDCAIRLVKSIREHHPDVRVLIGEQTKDGSNSPLRQIDAELHPLPYDYGVSASRNAIVSLVKTNYFLLCDDDFIFGPDTDISISKSILESDSRIGIVGGMLYDLYENDRLNHSNPRMWERLIHYDQAKRLLILTALQRTLPKPHRVEDTMFFFCDSVMNWALMRTSLFHSGILGWDPQFKISGEHEDFYLSRKMNHPEIGVAYCPSMIGYHHHSPHNSDYEVLRARMSGWSLFRQKWAVDQVVDDTFDRSRCTDTISLSTTVVPVTFQSFLDGALSTVGRRRLPPNAIGFDAAGSLYHTSNISAAPGLLLLNPAKGKLLATGHHRERRLPPQHDTEFERLKDQIRAIHSSTTWRLLQPLLTSIEKFPTIRKFLRRAVRVIWWSITLQLLEKLRERKNREHSR